ncbi:MAG: hypothetical protein U0804_28620 [Gemmataceae bacterium]
MSADNWTTCPRCVKRAQKAAEKLKADAAAAYGKVSEAVYTDMKERAAKGPEKVKQHFREDYEQGVDADGRLYVIYHGWCEDCGYGVDFKHEHQVSGIDE